MLDIANYSLTRHNTFGIEARCSRFIEYCNTAEAVRAASVVRESDMPFMVIGAGSNLLLTGDYHGLVVHSAIKGKSITEDAHGNALLRCGSGEVWDEVVEWSVNLGFSSLANLSLIPGDAGAASVQNIGAYGSEVCRYIREISAIEISSGKTVTISAEECNYGYRDSRFKHEWKGRFLITHVTLMLCREDAMQLEYGNIRSELERRGTVCPTPSDLRQAIIAIRKAKLPEPSEMGNAGSFFMNPVVDRKKYESLAADYPDMPHYPVDENREKIPAGWLIDKCGWKGKSMGRAGVYDKQALVLVNLGGASGNEIVELCNAIKKDVYSRFGIELWPEVNVV